MTRKITVKAAKRLEGWIEEFGVKPLKPDELAEVRANPDIDDDIGPPPLKARLGRPRKGERRSPTVAKTVKQTDEFWRAVEEKAKQRGLTVHEAMREAIAQWLSA